MKTRIVASFGFLAALLVGCPIAVPESPCDVGPCGGDGGTEGSVNPDTSIPDAKPDADPPPPGCDTPNEPLKNPEKCLVDAFGVFVSPTGDDGADGTKARPFKTLGKALAGAKSRIVVCEGTYPETLDIQRDVEIYGGIACSFTAAGKPASIESGKTIGLSVSRGSVLLTSLNVTAMNAVDPGDSSIGIVAASGTSLKVVGGAVVAGTGAEGAVGSAGSNYNAGLASSDPTIKGKDGSGNIGGATQTCGGLCVEAPSVAVEGGKGGNGDVGGGSPGVDGKTLVAGFPAFGKGGQYTNPVCNNGFPGAVGDPANGGAGAIAPGTIEAGKWTASRGGSGQTARPGQGGGGGSGGMSVSTGGGGGGGCGGCGGGKGQGGQSGGSSFALLSLGATVALENVTLTAGAGGKGGDGGAGQAGQGGGAFGAPASFGVGCLGGAGGQGGQGGGGGGGAGGHSAAVAYSGAKPSLKSITPQVAGTAALGGGAGVTGAATTPATAGSPGKTVGDLAL